MKKGHIAEETLNDIYMNSINANLHQLNTADETNMEWYNIGLKLKAMLEAGVINFEVRPLNYIFTREVMNVFHILINGYFPDEEQRSKYAFWVRRERPFTNPGDLYELNIDENGIYTKTTYSYFRNPWYAGRTRLEDASAEEVERIRLQFPPYEVEQRRQVFREKFARRTRLDMFNDAAYFQHFRDHPNL